MDLKEQAKLELAIRELEKRHTTQRESLYSFILHFWEHEKKITLDDNWHLRAICDKLEAVYRGEIKRLMINMPPRSLKTELISKAFTVWCLGKEPTKKFLTISYAAELAEKNSSDARNMYVSHTYKKIFPRSAGLRADQDTKKQRVNNAGGQVYASGSDGALTGFGADIILIDDPIKPGDADSDTVRKKVNNNYHDTIESRLNDKREGAIIIVMQRLHEDDLCGHLIDLELQKRGDKRDKLVIKAIAEEDEQYRKQGESFFPKRFPLDILHTLKKQSPLTFSTQYQQEPVNKDTQEFHEEWFRYHGEDTSVPTPSGLRVFTTVDPAFKKGQENDYSAIITGGFIENKLYILEYTRGRYAADELQDVILYHIRKRDPEKIGIEAYQAQSMILTFLKQKMNQLGIYKDLDEIKQSGDKFTKIRKLVPLYRDGLVYHKVGMDVLENELKKFPRGKNDDVIDALQMLYDMYTLQPNTPKQNTDLKIERDQYGNVVGVDLHHDDWL